VYVIEEGNAADAERSGAIRVIGRTALIQQIRQALPAMAKQRELQRALREETSHLVTSMPVPDLFSLPELVENIDRARKRRIPTRTG
jgi:hypothetical protein